METDTFIVLGRLYELQVLYLPASGGIHFSLTEFTQCDCVKIFLYVANSATKSSNRSCLLIASYSL